MLEHATALPAYRPEVLPPGALQLAAAGYLSRYKGASRDTKACDLKHFFAWCDSHQLDPLAARRPHLELYLRHMEEERGFQPSTVAKRASTVSGFYRAAVWDELLNASPAEHVRRPRVPRTTRRLGLTRRELTRYLEASAEGGPVDWALGSLMGILALRVSEACAIDLDDLGVRDGHRVVTIHGKGGDVDLMPLVPAVARAVDAAKGDREHGPLLLRQGGTRLTRVAAYRIVQRMAGRAGITHKISPHSLRHAVCTNLIDSGVGLREVQLHLRHRDPSTTLAYYRGEPSLDRHSAYGLAGWVAAS